MDKALALRVRKQAWFHRYPRGVPIVLFAAVCLAVLAIVIAVEETDAQRREVELERNTGEISSALRQRALEHIAILRAAAALFESRKIASQDDLNRLAEDLLPEDEGHGALGLGWAVSAEASAVPAYEAQMRARGFSNFKVWPRAPGETRKAVAVTYLAPLSPANRKAIGYDMYSDSMRRQAIDQAGRMRRPVATGKVTLIQDSGDPQPGFLIYMPVHEPSALGDGDLRGFVYSPFRSSELLDSAMRLTAARAVNIAIYDGVPGPDRLLAGRRLARRAGRSIVQPIQIGNRTWIVEVTENTPARITRLSQLVILAGSLFGILLLTISFLVIRRSAADRQALQWQSEQASIRSTLSRELNHRVKNTLANVLSIAALTRRRTNDIDAFYESFTGRVQALSATHDLLTKTEWSNTLIGDVVRSELRPYMDRGTSGIALNGPEIAIAANDALSLGLAIHELATNAAKYGALSTDGGKVSVTWRKVSPELCEIDWRESDGPPVSQPVGRGFGRDLLERLLSAELHSEVRLHFEPGGVECELRVPIRQATSFSLRSGA
jgi:two-component sensor histidine kinase/CHASE1-domain containing sensor protein